MVDVQSLSKVSLEDVKNIQEMTNSIVVNLDPLKVLLFGSFAKGNHSDDSDFDFYIVMPDGSNIRECSLKAYKSIRNIQRRPVDIVVGTQSRFDWYGNSPDSLYIEGEVQRNGVLLYHASEEGRGLAV